MKGRRKKRNCVRSLTRSVRQIVNACFEDSNKGENGNEIHTRQAVRCSWNGAFRMSGWRSGRNRQRDVMAEREILREEAHKRMIERQSKAVDELDNSRD